MSHFTVLVIGENPEEQLAPFQENNMGNCPREYMKFRVWGDDGEDHWFDNEEAFKNSGLRSEEKGYWENPNRKWDWYSLGGRWTGFFKLKVGVNEVVGRPGLMTEPAEDGYGDQCLKSEIDFEAMRDEAGLKAQNEYEEAMDIFGHLPKNRAWDEVRESFKGKIDEARDYYWSQARCEALRKSQSDLRWGNPDPFLASKETYIENARDGAVAPFAVIKDGKWYERGEMGWWGIVSNEKDKGEWNRQFSELIDSLPDDTLLSLYDCHI